MPGIEELKKFREEIASLGDEKKIVEERGEIYEELPLPTESAGIVSDVSSLDVDNLLASISADVKKNETEAGISAVIPGEGETVSEDPVSPPVTDFSDISLDGDPDKNNDSASDSDLAALDAMLASLPLGDPADLPETSAGESASGLNTPPDGTDASAAENLSGENSFADGDPFTDFGFSMPDFPDMSDIPGVPEMDSSAGTDGTEESAGEDISGSGVDGGFDLDSFTMPGIPEDFSVPGGGLPVDDADVLSVSDGDGDSPVSGQDVFPEEAEARPGEAAFADGDPFADSGFSMPDFPDMPDIPGVPEMDSAAGSGESSGEDISGSGVDGGFDLDSFTMPDIPEDFSVPGGGLPVDDADVLSVSDGDGDFPDMPDISDVPEMDSAAGTEESAGEDAFGAAGLDDMPEMPDMPDISGSSGDIGSIDSDGFNFNVEEPSLGDSPAGTSPDDFSFQEDGSQGFADSGIQDAQEITAGVEDFSGEDISGGKADKSDMEDFDGLQDLDGFEFDEKVLNAAIRNASSSDAVPGFSDFEKDGTGGKSRAGRSAKKEIPTEISEEEFERFLSILSRFPLNLRLAVEEFLSREEGTELQKMELVNNILTGLPLRKTANILEKYLDRSISIPRDFEKKNFEEYELEKSSLKYVFFNRILPVTVMSLIALVLTACVVFLSYQFIYRPVSAESLYKRGYVAIQDERYTQSRELFDQAVERWEKKRWYFTYARAYRDKNQYISAEAMYTRLLDRFDNDLDGGLEYAEMLRTDLRNFEKAETILRRRVLDYHVNNLDGLLLLGDVFLDWAEEDPSKYELARIQYASAAEIYGREDPVLVRMMRYFIRTNNLAEVLPLKEHFMDKRAEIGAADLIELGGYLLEKRYMPSAGDSDILRDAIGDLRTILERGVDSDPSIPEGHYNLGRFYIFNYKNDVASVFLNEALMLFPGLKQVSPRRVVTNVDAYRLLGEIRADEREYINAQELYAAGISLYEDRKAARSVPQDPRVGKLYADYADIDYFISNDWDSAMDNYSKAASELYDTASVRYKMGYIQYQKQNYEDALRFFVRSYGEVNTDGNILFSLGNTLFRRGSFNAARGYYEQLMEISEAERIRKGVILPQVRSDHGSFVEQYMHTSNNLGVTLYNISLQTGRKDMQGRAYALFSESARAWDALTRNPDTMIRAQGTNLAYLNMQNITAPSSGFSPEIYTDIPKTLTGEKVLQSRQD